MMEFAKERVDCFLTELHSKKPVPGGGGASALVGAVGAALAGMVGNLTTGKKKYAHFESDLQRILTQAEALRVEMTSLIDADAIGFAPLAAAYGMPAQTPEQKAEKAQALEQASQTACAVPAAIIRAAVKTLRLQEELFLKGSTLALSDVGVGAACLRAAIKGAWLNVVINTRDYTKAPWAQQLLSQLEPLVKQGSREADLLFDRVEARLFH